MIRTLNIILFITSVMALIGVYMLKYTVEETASRKLALETTIERQEADLSMIKADWAYLNQPIHIDPIVRRHAEQLGLQVINQKQIGAFDALPMRPVVEPDVNALDALFQTLDSGGEPPLPASGDSPVLPSQAGDIVVPAPAPLALRRPAAPVIAEPDVPNYDNPDALAALIESSED